MLRSLYAGVTGLTGNILELDVVGNNISNVNTVGYKSSRVTFQEILVQNVRPGTRPSISGTLGGTNPQQVGLGSVVGSIDSQFSQGNLVATGIKTDLALQGAGFFVLSDGTTQTFSRAGNFAFDANSTLVNASGLKVQGIMADENGEFTSSAIGDIQLDPSLVVPAEATTRVQVFGNLSSASDASGTHLEGAGAFLATAAGTQDLTSLYSGRDGNAMGLTDGDVISLVGSVNGTAIGGSQFVVGTDGTTVEDLRAFLQSALTSAGAAGATVTLLADGTLQIDNSAGAANLSGIRLTSGGDVAFNQTMIFGTDIAAGAVQQGGANLLRAAVAGDRLSDAFNERGESLAFDFQDDGAGNFVSTVEILGTLGGTAVTPTQVTIEQGVTTVGDLLSRMEQAFAVSNANGISLNANGQIDVQGDAGEAFAIGNLRLQEVGNPDSNLGAAVDFKLLEAAQDAGSYGVNSVIYDSLGGRHDLTLEFTKRTGENVWNWTASTGGDEIITGGGSGTVSFDENGQMVSFLFDDGSGQISMRPQATGIRGAAPLEIAIDPGAVGANSGLTQFEPADQLQALADGFTVGRLVDIDFQADGTVIGRFSNDTIRDLARLSLASFANEQGLERTGASAYGVAGNSGQPLYGFATEGGMGQMFSGVLETSNVDLAREFTKLVVAQRAFQSNAQVVSTSSEVLQDLVRIV